jgi:uncharacterized protein (TIGR03435 family)
MFAPRRARLVLIALLCRAALGAPANSFEAASVRPNKSAKARADIEFLPGGERFVATAVPLAALIMTAYGVTVPQCSCQSSFPVLSQRFDVQAKAEHPADPAEMLRLLQSLLADRFKLVIRREKKRLPAYALVVEESGPMLNLSAVPHENDAAPLNLYRARGAEAASGHLVFQDETMPEFAWRLSTLVVLEGRVVVDQTGLAGHYDFELKYGTGAPGSDGPSIFTAMREQLGLRLESRKLPLEVITVERVENPSAN